MLTDKEAQILLNALKPKKHLNKAYIEIQQFRIVMCIVTNTGLLKVRQYYKDTEGKNALDFIKRYNASIELVL